MTRSSTRSIRPVRLVRGHPIYLTRSGQPGEKELVSAFRSAWRLVPPAARRTILGYWCRPWVEVVDDLPGPSDANDYGHYLRFLGTACVKMPPDACIGLVLREIAHIYHCASYEPNHRVSSDVTQEVRQRCDVLATVTVAFHWGLGLYEAERKRWEKGWV